MNFLCISLFLFMGLGLYSCSGGQETPPSFTFKNNTGYTYGDDTVPVSTPVKFGVKAEKGGSKMETYTISVQYDNGATTQPQPARTLKGKDQTEFTRDTTITTRSVPGKELWIFNVRDKNGNSATRQVKLVVQ